MGHSTGLSGDCQHFITRLFYEAPVGCLLSTVSESPGGYYCEALGDPYSPHQMLTEHTPVLGLCSQL